jgi:hypothetical protein
VLFFFLKMLGLFSTTTRYHPEIVELRRISEEKKKGEKNLAKAMRKTVTDLLLSLDDKFEYADLHARARSILSGMEPGFDGVANICHSIHYFLKDAGRVVNESANDEGSLTTLMANHSSILQGLVSLEGSNHRKAKENLKLLYRSIFPLQTQKEFSIDEAETLQMSIRKSESDLSTAQTRISSSMISEARVLMSTIGSSHKLPSQNEDDDVNDTNYHVLEEQFHRLSIKDTKTICIFDEAGCIPSYELIGLSRLGIDIDAVVAVGDKKQLPPYDPDQNSFSKKGFRSRRSSSSLDDSKSKRNSVSSILDVSGQTIHDESKIKLTKQYRVPRNIAAVLNARIYDGDYQTPVECAVPAEGFTFINVPSDRNEKYVNKNEVEYCLDLVDQLNREKRESTKLVLTPVRNVAIYRHFGLMLDTQYRDTLKNLFSFLRLTF